MTVHIDFVIVKIHIWEMFTDHSVTDPHMKTELNMVEEVTTGDSVCSCSCISFTVKRKEYANAKKETERSEPVG